MDIWKTKYIIFDIFGTVVDWHGSIVSQGLILNKKYNLNIDWSKFASGWRNDGYFKATFDIAHGNREWVPADVIFMEYLNSKSIEYGLDILSDDDYKNLGKIWHRLSPWQDVLEGLNRLKTKYAIGPFSNGDFNLMIDIEKAANLPWDFITTGDLFKKFKPNPEVYRDEVKLLGVKPEEVTMVAAHPFDLDGAKQAGCTTIFVPRPLEYGLKAEYNEPNGKEKVDYILNDFIELAQLFGV
ncbi:MAG: haloacid dehalogenase type II [Lachnoclostridium edouardi]|uniref:haloacid dehalogenase type II n=1 Tax=Lachnoclostridium edouardi TaxID=1926283 RepID=UPI0026DD3B7C|nr:haloacid dehalogenase type II [Lachnoclostridium edouardi]MDO4279912.1 haloacid dehalogenase type II [Lachnoclostridium edouardi]